MASRQHHYLSQFYLKGFTKGESKKSKLTVIDIELRKVYETNPRNVGGIRDFNRIDADNISPDAIENAYSEFESKAAKSIKDISQGAAFEGENRNIILNLIALFSVRSPRNREIWRKVHEEQSSRFFDLALSSQNSFDSIINNMKKDGYSMNPSISYQEVKDFHERKNYKLELENAYNIELELKMIDPVLNTLAKRNWMLLRSINDNSPFITTDSPVVLTWITPENIPPFYQNFIGFGLNNTQVIFPLNRKLLLKGEFGKIDIDIPANEELVARYNRILLNFAQKQIFASKLQFPFFSDMETIVSGSQYFSFF